MTKGKGVNFECPVLLPLVGETKKVVWVKTDKISLPVQVIIAFLLDVQEITSPLL